MNLEFPPKEGVIQESKEKKNDAPPKIDQKCHFPSNKNPV